MQEIDLELERKEILNRYKGLLRDCKDKTDTSDKKIIRKAFNLAVEAHKEMRRKSGEPYIYHPIDVARIAAKDIGLDALLLYVLFYMMLLKTLIIHLRILSVCLGIKF